MMESTHLLGIMIAVALGMTSIIGWFLRMSYRGLHDGQEKIWQAIDKLKDEVRSTNGRLGRIETWTNQHEQQDNERQESIGQRLSRIERAVDK